MQISKQFQQGNTGQDMLYVTLIQPVVGAGVGVGTYFLL